MAVPDSIPGARKKSTQSMKAATDSSSSDSSSTDSSSSSDSDSSSSRDSDSRPTTKAAALKVVPSVSSKAGPSKGVVLKTASRLPSPSGDYQKRTSAPSQKSARAVPPLSQTAAPPPAHAPPPPPSSQRYLHPPPATQELCGVSSIPAMEGLHEPASWSAGPSSGILDDDVEMDWSDDQDLDAGDGDEVDRDDNAPEDVEGLQKAVTRLLSSSDDTKWAEIAKLLAWSSVQPTVQKFSRGWAKGEVLDFMQTHLPEYERLYWIDKCRAHSYGKSLVTEYCRRWYWRDPPGQKRIGPFPNDKNLTAEEKQLKAETMKYLNEVIPGWFKYRVMQAPKYILMSKPDDPWSTFCRNLTGHPRVGKKPANWQYFMHVEWESLAPEFNAHYKALDGQPKPKKVAERQKYCRSQFLSLASPLQQAWTASNDAAHKAKKDEEKKYLEEACKLMSPERTQTVVDRFGLHVDDLLSTVTENTGMHAVLLVGGPMPNRGGQIVVQCFTSKRYVVRDDVDIVQDMADDSGVMVQLRNAVTPWITKQYTREERLARAMDDDVTIEPPSKPVKRDVGMDDIDEMMLWNGQTMESRTAKEKEKRKKEKKDKKGRKEEEVATHEHVSVNGPGSGRHGAMVPKPQFLELRKQLLARSNVPLHNTPSTDPQPPEDWYSATSIDGLDDCATQTSMSTPTASDRSMDIPIDPSLQLPISGPVNDPSASFLKSVKRKVPTRDDEGGVKRMKTAETPPAASRPVPRPVPGALMTPYPSFHLPSAGPPAKAKEILPRTQDSSNVPRVTGTPTPGRDRLEELAESARKRQERMRLAEAGGKSSPASLVADPPALSPEQSKAELKTQREKAKAEEKAARRKEKDARKEAKEARRREKEQKRAEKEEKRKAKEDRRKEKMRKKEKKEMRKEEKEMRRREAEVALTARQLSPVEEEEPIHTRQEGSETEAAAIRAQTQAALRVRQNEKRARKGLLPFPPIPIPPVVSLDGSDNSKKPPTRPPTRAGTPEASASRSSLPSSGDQLATHPPTPTQVCDPYVELRTPTKSDAVVVPPDSRSKRSNVSSSYKALMRSGALTRSSLQGDGMKPEWLEEQEGILRAMDLGSRWELLLDQWVTNEGKREYEDKKATLPIRHRPAEVKAWQGNRSRAVSLSPDRLDPFGSEWWMWWRALQPGWRNLEEGDGALGDQYRQEVLGDLSGLDKTGKNGLLLVVSTLGWWGSGLKREGVWDEGGTGLVRWQEAVDDVLWVLEGLLF